MKRKKICLFGVVSVSVILMLFFYVIYFCEENETLTISKYSSIYLKDLQISKYSAELVKNVEQIDVNNIEIELTDEEIEEYISADLQSYNELVNVEDRDYVEEGDFVNVDYTVYLDGEIVNQKEGEMLKVGAGYCGIEFEKALIGMKLHETSKKIITIPEDDSNKSYAGKTEEIEITINSIQYMITQELSDRFVKENYELNSIEEYYEMVREKLIEEKETESVAQKNEDVILELLECCEIEIDENQMAQYSISKYDEYNQMAISMSMTIEEFAQQMMDMTIDEFIDMSYEEAEKEIKQIIAIGLYAAHNAISVTDEEVTDYIVTLGESEEEFFDSDEAYYNYVTYKVLEAKVVDTIISKVK